LPSSNEKTDLIGIKDMPSGVTVEGEDPPEPLRLHQEHPRGDDAGRMRSEMAELISSASSAANKSCMRCMSSWNSRHSPLADRFRYSRASRP
jgi:hypothetical protein